MSDEKADPHVNPNEFDTELAAVWYAANYYYKESFVRGGETTGIVFKKTSGKYALTVRMDGGYLTSKVRFDDVPKGQGNSVAAIWHTHIPGTRFCVVKGGELLCLVGILSDSLLGEYRGFSGKDTSLSERATKFYGHNVPIYLVTANLIKRYTPGKPNKEWVKDIPSKMHGVWTE